MRCVGFGVSHNKLSKYITGHFNFDMASQYNCTQFLNEFPEPKTEAAINNGIVSFMDALVK